MCFLTDAGSTFEGSSRHVGPVISPDLRVVLPWGPSQESCPFIGLLPHLFMLMGLPALHDSRTSILHSAGEKEGGREHQRQRSEGRDNG